VALVLRFLLTRSAIFAMPALCIFSDPPRQAAFLTAEASRAGQRGNFVAVGDAAAVGKVERGAVGERPAHPT
jgi:hypothetical protein